MPFTLALIWQASGDQTMMVLVGLIVLCLIVLGLKFLRAMFEVITAPQASLGHHGQTDGFVHSIIIVVLGGLIGALLLHIKVDEFKSAFGTASQAEAAAVSSGATNHNYADVIQSSVSNTLNSNFDNFVVNNIVFLPLLDLIKWFVVSLFCFLFARMLGGHCTMGGMAGAIAYSFFFGTIGFGLLAPVGAGMSLGVLSGTPGGAPALAPTAIIGLVLMVYALVLFLMAISQGGDLTVGQVIGVVIFTAVILGGSAAFGMYKAKEAYSAWTTTEKAYNPAVGGAKK